MTATGRTALRQRRDQGPRVSVGGGAGGYPAKCRVSRQHPEGVVYAVIRFLKYIHF